MWLSGVGNGKYFAVKPDLTEIACRLNIEQTGNSHECVKLLACQITKRVTRSVVLLMKKFGYFCGIPFGHSQNSPRRFGIELRSSLGGFFREPKKRNKLSRLLRLKDFPRPEQFLFFGQPVVPIRNYRAANCVPFQIFAIFRSGLKITAN